MMSQRTLFGIPSAVEQTIARAVAQDEEDRRMKQKNSAQPQQVLHPLDPVFDERSRVLVLGSMPSPASREAGFYYGHPQNRFWRVLARLFDEPVATTNERKRDQLLRHHIALWDVVASCTISGASDASIQDAVPNDLNAILQSSPIQAVFCTGSKAAQLYTRLCEPATGVPCVRLPSTSPANAAVKFDELVEAYREIVPLLDEAAPLALDVQDVVRLEQAIASDGTSLAELMDRAGTALAYRVHKGGQSDRVVILCGTGNNGGDGWIAARELAQRGHAVTLVTSRTPEELKAQPARDAALSVSPELDRLKAHVLLCPSPEELSSALNAADVIIDALLGTGFSGTSVKEPFGSWITAANARRDTGARVVSADVPSGLSAQTGLASEPSIIADETVTMIVSKPGLETPEAARYCGTVRVAPLAYYEHLL